MPGVMGKVFKEMPIRMVRTSTGNAEPNPNEIFDGLPSKGSAVLYDSSVSHTVAPPATFHDFLDTSTPENSVENSGRLKPRLRERR